MNTRRRFWEVMGGLFLILIALSALSSAPPPVAILFGLLGFYLVARQFDRTRTTPSGWNRAGWDGRHRQAEQPVRPASDAEQVYSHAIRAVRRAGLEPDDIQVLPVDIGIIGERDGRAPVVYRSQAIPDDVDYVRPFVQLRLPTRAVGRVRFEITDSSGQLVYVHEDDHQLERGRHLITPTSRLPIHDQQAKDSGWTLDVLADNVVIAQHLFDWLDTAVVPVRLDADGELSNELRAAVIDSQPASMSLDELLAHQEEATSRAKRQTR